MMKYQVAGKRSAVVDPASIVRIGVSVVSPSSHLLAILSPVASLGPINEPSQLAPENPIY